MNKEREVQQVLAKYVRAADRRDGAAMSSLFVEAAHVEIYEGQQEPRQIGLIEGAGAIGAAVAGMMKPHPAGGWSHHTTHDPIIDVEGDIATIDVQFIVYSTTGVAKPPTGWPKEAFGAQGRVEPIEAGYYRSRLVRQDDQWKIAEHRIYLDLPMAFPDAGA
jgi:hypothetical protein